jgi:hypothetical protein
MGVAKSHCKGVRRVMRGRRCFETEQNPDHVLHLELVRAPITHDRLLDLERTVFIDGQTSGHTGQESHAPHMPEPQGTLHVGGIEEVLHRNPIGSTSLDDLDQFGVYVPQFLGEAEPPWARDHAVLDECVPIPVRLDGAKARDLRARVDSEDSQDGSSKNGKDAGEQRAESLFAVPSIPSKCWNRTTWQP